MEIRALGENTYLIQIQSPPDDFKPTKMEIARREKYQAMNDLLTLFPSLEKHELQMICIHALRYIQEE